MMNGPDAQGADAHAPENKTRLHIEAGPGSSGRDYAFAEK